MFTAADAYGRHVGRYGGALARAHVAAAGLARDQRALDVGCGPGALTAVLADVLGADQVAAVDPSEGFVEACRRKVPGADVRLAAAEELPDFGSRFDVVTSQLVLNFMTDPRVGVAGMMSQARPGGTVASVVWDYSGGMEMLRAFWDAALALDPGAPDEGRTMDWCTPGELQALWLDAGLEDVQTRELVIEAAYESFEDYWDPFPTGIGPSGAYCAALDPERREALRRECRRRLGSPQRNFTLNARAWFVRGTSPGAGRPRSPSR